MRPVPPTTTWVVFQIVVHFSAGLGYDCAGPDQLAGLDLLAGPDQLAGLVPDLLALRGRVLAPRGRDLVGLAFM